MICNANKYISKENKRFDFIPIEYKPLIEKALEIKLYDYQCEFLFKTPIMRFPSGRKIGKTLTTLIYQILVYKEIPINNNLFFIDRKHATSYKKYLKNQFLEVREKLNQAGLPVCILLKDDIYCELITRN